MCAQGACLAMQSRCGSGCSCEFWSHATSAGAIVRRAARTSICVKGPGRVVSGSLVAEPSEVGPWQVAAVGHEPLRSGRDRQGRRVQFGGHGCASLEAIEPGAFYVKSVAAAPGVAAAAKAHCFSQASSVSIDHWVAECWPLSQISKARPSLAILSLCLASTRRIAV